MARLRIECAPAGDQLEFARAGRAIDLLVRERRLLILHDRGHLEGRDSAVGQIHFNLIAGLQGPELELFLRSCSLDDGYQILGAKYAASP